MTGSVTDTLFRLCQDRLITHEQVAMLTNIAEEFAKLNEIPAATKHLSEQLLRTSKQIIGFLETKSS